MSMTFEEIVEEVSLDCILMPSIENERWYVSPYCKKTVMNYMKTAECSDEWVTVDDIVCAIERLVVMHNAELDKSQDVMGVVYELFKDVEPTLNEEQTKLFGEFAQFLKDRAAK